MGIPSYNNDHTFARIVRAENTPRCKHFPGHMAILVIWANDLRVILDLLTSDGRSS